MPDILIRGLDAQAVKRLKTRAKQHGRSLQGEAKLLLEQAAGIDGDQVADMFDGWKKLTQKILLKVPNDQKNETKNILHQLGEKIGSEWCRDNGIRKIDTEMLLKWGGNLKETLDSDPERITEAIRTIDTDVNKILHNDQGFSA